MKQTLTLDSTQVAVFSKCSQKWSYTFEENLELGTKPKKSPLSRGQYIHLLLETYYAMRALNPAGDRSKQATSALELVNHVDYVDEDLRKLIFERLMQYVLFYTAGDFMPAVIDGEPSVEVGFSKPIYEDDDYLFILEGRIDLIARLKTIDGLIFIDHKSQERAKDYYSYTPQFLCYALATGAKYGMYNYFGLQKQFNDKTFRRSELISFSPELLEDFRQWLISIFKRVARRDVYKNFHACQSSGDWYPCEFHQLCKTYNEGIKNTLKRNAYVVREPWSPWNEEEN